MTFGLPLCSSANKVSGWLEKVMYHIHFINYFILLDSPVPHSYNQCDSVGFSMYHSEEFSLTSIVLVFFVLIQIFFSWLDSLGGRRSPLRG